MTAPKRPQFPNGPIRTLDHLAHYVSQQFPEFHRRQMLAVINFAFHTIGKSLEDQAALGEQRPRVELCRLGAFELRWYPGMRCPKLGGGLRDVAAHWRPRFVFNRAWRNRFKSARMVSP